jgi:hypothetical protein
MPKAAYARSALARRAEPRYRTGDEGHHVPRSIMAGTQGVGLGIRDQHAPPLPHLTLERRTFRKAQQLSAMRDALDQCTLLERVLL